MKVGWRVESMVVEKVDDLAGSKASMSVGWSDALKVAPKAVKSVAAKVFQRAALMVGPWAEQTFVK